MIRVLLLALGTASLPVHAADPAALLALQISAFRFTPDTHHVPHSTRTEVSSEIISSMRSRSGIHGASLIMRTWEMMGVRSGKV